MRSDVAFNVQACAFSAPWTGFSLVDPLLSDEDGFPLDAQVAALTLTIRNAFEPDSPPDRATMCAQVVPAILSYLGEARSALEQQIQVRRLPLRQ